MHWLARHLCSSTSLVLLVAISDVQFNYPEGSFSATPTSSSPGTVAHDLALATSQHFPGSLAVGTREEGREGHLLDDVDLHHLMSGLTGTRKDFRTDKQKNKTKKNNKKTKHNNDLIVTSNDVIIISQLTRS